MRKIILIAIVLFFIAGIVYGESKSNVYELTTGVNLQQQTRGVTFPFDSRDLIIKNNSASWVNVDVNSANTTSCSDETAGCFVINARDSIELYDYITSGVSLLLRDANNTPASPVSVIVTY